MKYTLTIILLITLFFSCGKPEIPEASLSVEAYLYAGQPVNQIKLSLVKPIEDEQEQPVSDADVFIIWNGRHYLLTETPDKPGWYHFPDETLMVEANNAYTLYIKYHEQEYYAETTVPLAPLGLTASKDTIDLAIETDEIAIAWQNNDSTWFLGAISPELQTQTDLPFNNFFSLPTQANSTRIKTNNVHTTGYQTFVLYGITEEYAKLYRISSSSIGATNVGNISNGFGIFAAFSSDTLTFIAMGP